MKITYSGAKSVKYVSYGSVNLGTLVRRKIDGGYRLWLTAGDEKTWIYVRVDNGLIESASIHDDVEIVDAEMVV